MGVGRVNFAAVGALAAYSEPHDDAHVHPVLVGRLTAADVTCAHTAAAPAAVLVSPS